MRQFFEGDLVRVHGHVVWDNCTGNVGISLGNTNVYLEQDQVQMVQPNLKHGDIVLHGQDEVTVIANHDSKCWIEHPINGSNIVLLEDLRRKEETGRDI